MKEFIRRVRRSRRAIGLQLMDQAVIAGVGNIYRAEALFRASLHPDTPGRHVSAETLAKLWDDLVTVMRDGVRTGRIITTRPEHRTVDAPGVRVAVRQNTDGVDAVPREASWYVYQRTGLDCRICATPIAERVAAGRNLFWCPMCQRD